MKIFLISLLHLIVEILSPATALKDRHFKFSLYENFGVKYYVIIDQDKEDVEIYCLENSKYVLQKNSRETSFIFSLDDNCIIEVLPKNFFE